MCVVCGEGTASGVRLVQCCAAPHTYELLSYLDVPTERDGLLVHGSRHPWLAGSWEPRAGSCEGLPPALV